MGRRILVGSMLILFLLLVMPCIPALQQHTIKEEMREESQEKLESVYLGNFPLLNRLLLFIDGILYYRLIRSFFLLEYSTEVEWHGYEWHYKVTHPILLVRGVWLFGTTEMLYGILYFIYNLVEDDR